MLTFSSISLFLASTRVALHDSQSNISRTYHIVSSCGASLFILTLPLKQLSSDWLTLVSGRFEQ